ncbi:MAG: cation-translocating P-type ATPase [Verrucomicrobia bacterium]|nr:cation-translocating P-type ATPase [Verrucomicrobiota bacterium]
MKQDHYCPSCPKNEKNPTRSAYQKESKLVWLGIGAALVAVFEFLSLAGIRLPDPIALPFFLAVTVIFGYQTLWHGLQALLRLNFRNINSLMLIAVTGAFYLKEYPEGTIVIILFALAERLEDIGIEKSQSAIDQLINKMPKMAQIKGKTQEIPIDQVQIGEIMLVKPFDMIPLDGLVKSGVSFVDEAPITGEPIAKDKRNGDLVFAGTLNKQGFLEIEVTKTSSDSTLAKIKELTFNAIKNKSETQKFIEKFSRYYTPTIILLALAWTIFPWLVLQRPFDQGFSQAIILLVIACPCALVISTPISIFSAIGNASSSGALIKGGKYLEIIGQIKAIALDKTRTLTYGEPVVTDILPFGQTTKEDLLGCAAGIEAFSEHPLAQSITDSAKEQQFNPHKVENFESIVGKGAKADCLVCDEKHHCIGKLEFILEEHKVPQEIVQKIEELQKQGKTVIVVSTHQEVEGIIALEDKVRPDSAELISKLHSLGITTIMLTGDHSNAAASIAKSLGINHVKADLLPEDKSQAISELVKKYGTVGMFGDGINDAPALALSSVGISISSLGSDTALEAASIVLLNDRLNLIPFLVLLGRKTLTTIKINTSAAILIKILFVGLALLGLANLALAIFADVGVTILVILYSLRLMKWKGDKSFTGIH